MAVCGACRLCLFLAALLLPSALPAETVRCAVIGGMTMTGVWQRIAERFEAETGITVLTVATGQRAKLARAMESGQVDLLTMHSGDITTDLVADGYAKNLRPWCRNQLVIAGPRGDPAGIRGLESGSEAFRRIAHTKSPFIDFRGTGSREVCHSLWTEAGIEPVGYWVLKDNSEDHLRVMHLAQQREAYVVVGEMPVLFGKLPSNGLEIMVRDDPDMRRPYVVMEVNPDRFPEANPETARRLADFLLSDSVQRFLESDANRKDGRVLFYPLPTRP